MSIQVSQDCSIRGFQAVRLENEYIQMAILPELGAKIWEFTYKPQSVQFLWHNPDIDPTFVPFYSNYVEHFSGGWDELFPNDIPEEINGEQEPDHGETWSLPWKYKIIQNEENEVTLYMWVNTVIQRSLVEKWITVKSGTSNVSVRYRIKNTGDKNLPFMWKMHMALHITQHSRVYVGAKQMHMESFCQPRFGRPGTNYEWPYVIGSDGSHYDMREVLEPDTGIYELQYATQMIEGWCSLEHTDQNVMLRIDWDVEKLSTCWVFASFGGFNGYQTVILEPCTGYPMSVMEGIQKGTHRKIEVGESFEFTLLVSANEGVDH